VETCTKGANLGCWGEKGGGGLAPLDIFEGGLRHQTLPAGGPDGRGSPR